MTSVQDIENRAYTEAEQHSVLPGNLDVEENIVYVSLRTVIAICQKIGGATNADRAFIRKKDESPVTKMDPACEVLGKEMFEHAFGDRVAYIGEEGGGEFVRDGICVAIDPIDGTWGFVGDTGAFSVTLNIYKDGKPHIGVIAQPSASELLYAADKDPTRLLRAGRWGTPPTWDTMPQTSAEDRILINMHGRPSDKKFMNALYDAWKVKTVRQVRSVGGSPALGMSEVAKGTMMYTANWVPPTSPHDLGAAIKIIQNAGGKTVDLNGAPIEAVGHTGMFISGLKDEHTEIVRQILRNAS